jgi:hypothetical protein
MERAKSFGRVAASTKSDGNMTSKLPKEHTNGLRLI